MEAATVVKVEGGWAVRIPETARRVLEYRYGSEQQARFMAAVLEMKPARVPKPDAVWTQSRPRRSSASKALPKATKTSFRDLRFEDLGPLATLS